jgi:hypothetical protein
LGTTALDTSVSLPAWFIKGAFQPGSLLATLSITSKNTLLGIFLTERGSPKYLQGNPTMFFLEHAGELRIISLKEG